MSIKVGIIGAGPAGLCAARHISKYLDKLKPIIFEQGSSLGGNWVYTERKSRNTDVHSSVYSGMRTNIPKEVMAFQDFAFPAHEPSFMHHSVVYRYLQSYAAHFNLKKYIKFNNSIQSTSPLGEDRGWSITTKNNVTQEQDEYQVDYLLACNGHFSVPRFPDVPGLQDFRGQVVHSHDYRRASDFSGKTVMILGAGFSGQDIGLQLSKTAKLVYISHNKPAITTALPSNLLQVDGVIGATETGFNLRDGSHVHADAILFCTGYQYSYPFLPKGFLSVEDNRVFPLYKHLIHCLNPSICFVGIPYAVSPFPMMDIQVQFYLKYILGDMKLPSKTEMLLDTEKDYVSRMEDGMHTRHTHMIEKQQWTYQEDLATLAGIEKTSPQVVRDLFRDVTNARQNDLINYKDGNFKIIDDKTYISIPNRIRQPVPCRSEVREPSRSQEQWGHLLQEQIA